MKTENYLAQASREKKVRCALLLIFRHVVVNLIFQRPQNVKKSSFFLNDRALTPSPPPLSGRATKKNFFLWLPEEQIHFYAGETSSPYPGKICFRPLSLIAYLDTKVVD